MLSWLFAPLCGRKFEMLRTTLVTAWKRKTRVACCVGVLVVASSNDAASWDGASKSWGSISLHPEAWDILFSPNMPTHPFPSGGGGWYFDFPECDDVRDCSVHYVNTPLPLTLKQGQRSRRPSPSAPQAHRALFIKPTVAAIRPLTLDSFCSVVSISLTTSLTVGGQRQPSSR
jgi:hypothetical protein